MDAALDYVLNTGPTVINDFAHVLVEAAQSTDDPTSPAMQRRAITKATDVLKSQGANKGNIAAATGLLNHALNPPGNLQAFKRAPVLESAVRALNYMEHEMVTASVLKRPIEEIKIGTEFTFGDGLPKSQAAASYNIRTDMPKAPDNESKAQKESREKAYTEPRAAAQKCIEAWTAAARAGAGDISGKPTVQVETHDGKAGFAKKVTYTFRTTNDTWSWYWVADIDEACYETQTQPTSVRDLRQQGAVREIIEKHIFGLARTVKLGHVTPPKRPQSTDPPLPVGLHPDQTSTGGGGHITFDVDTAFADSTGQASIDLLLATLGSLQMDAESMSDRFRKDTNKTPITELVRENDTERRTVPKDTTNAPTLDIQHFRQPQQGGASPLQQYIALVRTIRTETLLGGTGTVQDLQRRLKQFNTTLTNPTVDPGERKTHLEHQDNISHYQAINTEHLSKDPGQQRIEIRDIPAQADYRKFLQDLQVLVEVLQAARDRVQKQQRTRLTS